MKNTSLELFPSASLVDTGWEVKQFTIDTHTHTGITFAGYNRDRQRFIWFYCPGSKPRFYKWTGSEWKAVATRGLPCKLRNRLDKFWEATQTHEHLS